VSGSGLAERWKTLSLTYFRPQGIGIANWKIKITLTLPDNDSRF
jgi:hypothetical protein